MLTDFWEVIWLLYKLIAIGGLLALWNEIRFRRKWHF